MKQELVGGTYGHANPDEVPGASVTASPFIRAAIPVALAFLAAVPLFAGAFTPVITLSTVADSATLIPGGSGTFTSFNPGLTAIPPDPCISNGNVSFWGAGIGQQGIYATLFGKLTKIADLNTTIPGTTQTFVSFPPDPMISGGNVAFIGNGEGTQGNYVGFPPDPIWPPGPVRIADLNTAVPGGTGNFISFTPTDPTIPPDPMRISGTNLAFVGYGSGGQQGVYATFILRPIHPAGPD